MKVRFISSGNSQFGINPIVQNQVESLKPYLEESSLFTIQQKGLRGYWNAVSLLKRMRNESQILHAHYALCGIVALLSKKKQKVVVSFMGDDLVGTNRADGSVTFISKIFVRVNKILARYFYDHSIVKSEEMQKVLPGYRNISLIPNGVDTNKFHAIDKDEALKKTGWDPGKSHIIFVSNPERAEKNYKLAQDAVNLLNDQHIELHVISGMDNAKLVYCYNAADALIMTSFHEGSPNVVKEAMACNCPVVSTDVGDVRWLTGGTVGHYITSFEPENAAEKLKDALQFSRTSGRTKGRERITELGLDSENIAKKIIEVYEIVLGKKNNRK